MDQNLIDELTAEFNAVDGAVIAVLVGELSDKPDGLFEIRAALQELSLGAQQVESFPVESIPEDTATFRNTTGKSIDNQDILKKYGSDVLYLHECFPEEPMWILAQKLSESDGKIDVTMDILLNKAYLKTLHEDEIHAAINAEAESRKDKKKKSKKKKTPSTLVVPDRAVSIENIAKLVGCSTNEAEILYDENCQDINRVLNNTNRLISWATKDSPANATTSSSTTSRDSVRRSPSSRSSNGSFERTAELYQKVSEYHARSRSNPLLRGAAHYYATEAAEEKLKAYESFINAQTTLDSVDYHRVPTDIAVDHCIRLLKAKQLECRGTFHIITGSGTHSVGNVPKTKNAIRKLLSSTSYDYTEENAGFNVSF